jgi:acyl-homoserine lactone acylase PvdQ
VRRRWAQGRLSEIFGGAGTSELDSKLLIYDKKMRVLGYSRHNQAVYNNLDDRKKEILDAFTAGVNQAMQEMRDSWPSGFGQLGITQIEPWQPSDSLDAWSAMGNVFGGANIQVELNKYDECKSGSCDPEPCGAPQPTDNLAAQVPEPAGGINNWPPTYDFQTGYTKFMNNIKRTFYAMTKPKWNLPAIERPEYVFKASHAWAISGDKTTTGKPLLSMDPKITVHASTFLYPFKLSVGGFNIRGSGLAGAPAMLIFWNQHLGHTPTSSGGDFVDLLDIQTLSDSQYQIEDQVYEFGNITETIRRKNGSTVSLNIKTTIFGPVLPPDTLNNQDPSKTYAIRHLEHLKRDDHSMFRMFDTMFTSNLAQYTQALNGYVFPSVNLLYADKGEEGSSGNIAYFLGAGVPERQDLVVDGRDLRGRYPIQVNTISDVWTRGLDLLEAPHVINPERGYQVSANDLVVGDWYQSYAYVGAGSSGNTFRGYQVKTEIEQYLSDDGKISPQEMKQIQLSGKMESVKVFRDMLQALALAGELNTEPPLDRAATTDEEKAWRILGSFSEFLESGGQLEEGNKFSVLIRNFIAGPASMITQSRSIPLACEFNSAEPGLSRIFREFKQDNRLVLNPDVKEYLLRSSRVAWNRITQDLGYSEDYTQWESSPPIQPYRVSQYFDFICEQLGFNMKTTTEPFCQTKDYGVVTEVNLKRWFPNQINASSTSQFTSMVDFSNLNESVSYVPFGTNEDPQAATFGRTKEIWEAVSSGNIDSLPKAPLKTSDGIMDPGQTITLTYP